MKIEELRALLGSYPLAIEEHALRVALEMGPEAAVGGRGGPSERFQVVGEGIAVLPIVGMVLPRVPEVFEEVGLATSTTRLAANITRAAANPKIKQILLPVDSPGGSTRALPEAAAAIRAARESKPVVAQVEGMAASAAYWLASNASEIVATPSADVGSIGVYTMHVDESQAMENEGVKVTYIHAGRDKVLGNPSEPLSKEARAHIQAQVDEAYADFVGDVALGRGVDESTVRGESFGMGRVMNARAGLQAGLVDRIDTFGHTLARMAEKTVQANSGLSVDDRYRALRLIQLRGKL